MSIPNDKNQNETDESVEDVEVILNEDEKNNVEKDKQEEADRHSSAGS